MDTGYVISSDKVIDNFTSDFAQQLLSSIPEADACEMEGTGAAVAIKLLRVEFHIGIIMIRVISGNIDAEGYQMVNAQMASCVSFRKDQILRINFGIRDSPCMTITVPIGYSVSWRGWY